MNNHLEVQRDRKLEPLQGQALVRTDNVLHMPLQDRKSVYVKPKVIVVVFVTLGGLLGFLYGALSL